MGRRRGTGYVAAKIRADRSKSRASGRRVRTRRNRSDSASIPRLKAEVFTLLDKLRPPKFPAYDQTAIDRLKARIDREINREPSRGMVRQQLRKWTQVLRRLVSFFSANPGLLEVVYGWERYDLNYEYIGYGDHPREVLEWFDPFDGGADPDDYVCVRPEGCREYIIRMSSLEGRFGEMLEFLFSGDSGLYNVPDLFDISDAIRELEDGMDSLHITDGILLKRGDYEYLPAYNAPRPSAEHYPFIHKAISVGYRPSFHEQEFMGGELNDAAKHVYGNRRTFSHLYNEDPEFVRDFMSANEPTRRKTEKVLPKALRRRKESETYDFSTPEFIKSAFNGRHVRSAYEQRQFGKKHGWCFGSGEIANEYDRDIKNGLVRLYIGTDPQNGKPVAIATARGDRGASEMRPEMDMNVRPGEGIEEYVSEAKYPQNAEAIHRVRQELNKFSVAKKNPRRQRTTNMGRRKSTGYVASKIRAHTARKNGGPRLRLPPRRAMQRAAREYGVQLEGQPHSYALYDADGGYAGEIDISLQGVRYSRFGYEQDGTAHWMPGSWGASISAETIIAIAEGLIAGFTFAASVEEFGDGILTTRAPSRGNPARGRRARKNYGWDPAKKAMYENKPKFLELIQAGRGEQAVESMRSLGVEELDFKGADISGAQLSGLDLSKSDFEDAVADRTDFAGANLRGSRLANVDFQSADLSGADLRDANLHMADLSFADLRGADLRGANLHAANLSATDTRGADFREVDMDMVWLEGTKYDATTKWPPGFTPPPSATWRDDVIDLS